MFDFHETGRSFIVSYFRDLKSNIDALKTLYHPNATLDWQSNDGKTYRNKQFGTNESILEFLTSDEVQKPFYQIIHIISQPMIHDCILITAHGIMIPDTSNPREDVSFECVFVIHLVPKKSTLVLLNQFVNINSD